MISPAPTVTWLAGAHYFRTSGALAAFSGHSGRCDQTLPVALDPASGLRLIAPDLVCLVTRTGNYTATGSSLSLLCDSQPEAEPEPGLARILPVGSRRLAAASPGPELAGSMQAGHKPT